MTAVSTTGGGVFFWEDVEVGTRERSGSLVVSAPEIIDFAKRFDPLPIHVDLTAAEAGPFGGLTASGSHMFAIRNRLLHDFKFSTAVIASLGVDEVRYVAPLRPGQTCQVEVEFLEKTPSRSKPDRGSTRIRMTLLADGVPVMSLIDLALMRRRPIAEPESGMVASTP